MLCWLSVRTTHERMHLHRYIIASPLHTVMSVGECYQLYNKRNVIYECVCVCGSLCVSARAYVYTAEFMYTTIILLYIAYKCKLNRPCCECLSV